MRKWHEEKLQTLSTIGLINILNPVVNRVYKYKNRTFIIRCGVHYKTDQIYSEAIEKIFTFGKTVLEKLLIYDLISEIF